MHTKRVGDACSLTGLVDDVSAYSSAMRRKLTLMGDTAVASRAFKAAAVVNGKTRRP
jgi:hypothetical protein